MNHLDYLKQIGRRGGKVRSAAKTLAARKNASRPRKKTKNQTTNENETKHNNRHGLLALKTRLSR